MRRRGATSDVGVTVDSGFEEDDWLGVFCHYAHLGTLRLLVVPLHELPVIHLGCMLKADAWSRDKGRDGMPLHL